MKRILLVEDEALIAMAEKLQLEQYGYAVRTVTTGEKAVEAAKTSSDIDLILMDINLGDGIDGTEAAGIILEDHDMPIVFLSSHTEPETVEKTEKITSYGYVVKSSSIFVLHASIKMALKLFEANQRVTNELAGRKQAEETTREQRDFSKSLVETAQAIILVLDTQGHIVRFNPYTEELLGYSLDEVQGMDWIEAFIRPEDVHNVKTFFRSTVDHNRTAGNVNSIVAKDGHTVFVKWCNKTLQDADGHTIGVLATGNDITEHKHRKDTLEKERHRLSAILDGTNVGTWEWNVQTGETRFNERWATMIGYTLQEISPVSIETWEHFAHPEDLQRSEEALRAHFAGEAKFYDVEARMRHKDGHWVWVLDRGKVTTWTEDGNPEWVFGTHQEMTERKRAEEEVQKQLIEKEALLREVHHRVKNNMTTIESLLSLQAGSMAHAEAKTALQDTISRVQSMRVLYDKLLVSNDLHEISMKSYAEDLIDSLVMVFDPENSMTIETHIADFEIGPKDAFSLGIIINELLTNVFKYAFGDREDGLASVSIDKEDGNVTLIIQDNGCGFDERALENKSPGFGLTVIRMLVEQLGGTYSLSNDNGAKSVVRIEA